MICVFCTRQQDVGEAAVKGLFCSVLGLVNARKNNNVVDV